MSGVKFAEKAPSRIGTMTGTRYWQNYTILVEVHILHLETSFKGSTVLGILLFLLMLHSTPNSTSKAAITQFQQRVWWLVPALVPIIVIPK
jgi:hypothetical protein